MLKLIKVTGDSLSPFFLPGDYVLTGNCPRLFGKISEGDTIVFSHDSFGLLIKEVSRVDPQLQQYSIKGHHHHSINSRKLGPISFSDIHGKVILHFKRPATLHLSSCIDSWTYILISRINPPISPSQCFDADVQ